ncbi:MAG: hypothetical protein GY927_06365 [bacterium]|nr:hypothetical protein [bacterium]
MFRTINLLFVTFLMFAVWAGPGAAFQLFGDNSIAQGTGDISVPYKVEDGSKSAGQSSLSLGDGGDLKSSEQAGLKIWVPGLGVVGKMPKLDFGLEMLYGAAQTPIDAPRTAQELDEFESDFAIKGTIKRKF